MTLSIGVTSTAPAKVATSTLSKEQGMQRSLTYNERKYNQGVYGAMLVDNLISSLEGPISVVTREPGIQHSLMYNERKYSQGVYGGAETSVAVVAGVRGK